MSTRFNSATILRRASVAALATIAACSTAGADEQPGRETGPCIESQCFDGLSCRGDLCVDALDEATSDAHDDGPGVSDTSAGSNPPDATTGATTGDTTGDTTGEADGSSDAPVDPDGVPDDGVPDDGVPDDGIPDDGDPDDSFDDDSFDDDSFDDGVSFIADPTDGASIECDIWQQDCPDGEKCNAWASGGASWDATACFTVVDSPDDVGDSCTAQDSGATGVDTCVAGAICWDVDPETLVGECIAYCGGSPQAPLCGGGTSCAIANDDVLAICVPSCDPILQDCMDGQGCYPVGAEFVCAPDVSAGAGYGDSCQNINTCAAGHACLEPAFVGACAGGVGCCTPFCDLDEPNGCPGAGQTCVAAYADGEAPPQWAHVGYCGLDA